MNEQSNIERVVMRRVHTIHILRPFLSPAALAALVAVLALWGIGREVWVAKVFANAPHTFLGTAQYLTYAFDHTKIAVQALTLLTAAAALYLARETARLLASALRLVEAA